MTLNLFVLFYVSFIQANNSEIKLYESRRNIDTFRMFFTPKRPLSIRSKSMVLETERKTSMYDFIIFISTRDWVLFDYWLLSYRQSNYENSRGKTWRLLTESTLLDRFR